MTPPRKRAPNGASETTLLIRLPSALKELTEGAAKISGITVSEWWRRAARDRLTMMARELDDPKAQGEG